MLYAGLKKVMSKMGLYVFSVDWGHGGVQSYLFLDSFELTSN